MMTKLFKLFQHQVIIDFLESITERVRDYYKQKLEAY